MKTNAHPPALARTLIWLTLFFAGAQILYYTLSVITSGIIHVLASQAVTYEFLKTPIVVIPIFIYLGSQFLLYASFVYAIWYMTHAVSRLCSFSPDKRYSFGVLLWLVSVITIVTANTSYFRQSMFALPTTQYWQLLLIKFFNWTGLLFLGGTILLSLIYLARALATMSLTRRDGAAIFLSIVTYWLLLDYTTQTLPQVAQDNHVAKPPNIILISVEALRPDYLAQPDTMPFLNSQLQDSIQFTDAYTPIAQSFPSWISLLTGRTPLHNGARSFYANFANLDFRNALTNKLRQHGYETMYAVDGQRFGDMTTQLGFDRVISPPCGGAELIIGSMSDFPLSNLLLLTRTGKVLFPYSYANRTIAATYHPDDFIELITSALKTRSEKPLFLSVHFGISHWPYRWANDELHDSALLADKYRTSLHAADAQIKQFYSYLQQEKILDHAVVIFISDHGTGLGMPGDSLTSEKKFVGKDNIFSFLQRLPYSHNHHHGTDTSYGYSTNILSLQQFHVLLAFKSYGVNIGKPRQIDARASLMDITPTLLDLLHIAAIPAADGTSLLPAMQKQAPLAERKFFFENGFTSPEIAQANLSVANVLQNSIQTVLIDPQSGLLYLNDHAEKSLLKHKQRAVLSGDWLLARYTPDVMILANVKTGQWTTDWNSSLAKQAPLKKLMQDFRQYNEGEI